MSHGGQLGCLVWLHCDLLCIRSKSHWTLEASCGWASYAHVCMGTGGAAAAELLSFVLLSCCSWLAAIPGLQYYLSVAPQASIALCGHFAKLGRAPKSPGYKQEVKAVAQGNIPEAV